MNYGASAQTMFAYKTDALANASLEDKTIADVEASTLQSYAKTVGAAIDGVTYKGTTAVWETNMEIRHYFDITGNAVTFKLQDASGTDMKDLTVEDGTYGKYVAIDNIVAKEMGTTYKVVISNGTATQTIDYSVYSYFYDILKAGTYSEAQIEAVEGAYHYSQAAINYFNWKNNPTE